MRVVFCSETYRETLCRCLLATACLRVDAFQLIRCYCGVQTGRRLLTREAGRRRVEGTTKSSLSVLRIEHNPSPVRSLLISICIVFCKTVKKWSITFHWCIRQRLAKKASRSSLNALQKEHHSASKAFPSAEIWRALNFKEPP